MLALALVGFGAFGCYESPQQSVELALELAGTPASDAPLSDEGTARLSRAELAFGPFWLCPGAQAGELCDTARLEWLDAARVDVLSSSAQSVGELRGVTGEVQSYMYDLGISSLLGEPGSSFVAPVVDELGGSVWLEGTASVRGVDVPFGVRLTIATVEKSEQGVPVVRKSTSEAFSHRVSEADEALRVEFDPNAWLGSLRASDLLVDAPCAEGVELGCREGLELRCEAGVEVGTRSCAALDQACRAGEGCVEQLGWSEDEPAYRALVQAVTAGVRPRFEFR